MQIPSLRGSFPPETLPSHPPPSLSLLAIIPLRLCAPTGLLFTETPVLWEDLQGAKAESSPGWDCEPGSYLGLELFGGCGVHYLIMTTRCHP